MITTSNTNKYKKKILINEVTTLFTCNIFLDFRANKLTSTEQKNHRSHVLTLLPIY